MLGVPGIAVSQQSLAREMDFRLGERFDFAAAAAFAARIVDRLDDVPLPEGTLLNINVPAGDPDGVEVARLGKRIYRDELDVVEEEDGRRRFRIYGDSPVHDDEPGTDLAAVVGRPRGGDAAALRPHRRARARGAARLRPRGAAAAGRRGGRRVSGRRTGRAELREQLAHHGHRYYVLDDPEIGDDAYDALLDELRALEARAPGAAHARLPDPAGRRRAGLRPGQGHPPAADALARQRALGGGAARLGARACAPTSRARGSRTRTSSFVAEPKIDGLAISLRLPRRRARARRHARQRRGRRGRHPQPAHDRRDPAAHRRTRRRCSRCAARSTCRCPTSPRSTSAAPRPGLSTFMNPRNSRRGHDPPARPGARRRAAAVACGATGIGVTEGLDARLALGGAGVAARARLPRQRRRQAARHRGRGRRAVPGLAGAPRRAGLRDRRRGRQGRRRRAAAAPRRRRPRPALGDRLEVPAHHRGHDAARGALERRQVRRPAPVRARWSPSTSAASPSSWRRCTTRRTSRARTSGRATR